MVKVKKFIIFLFLFYFALQGVKTEIYYPWKDVFIGALEAKAWAGLVIAPSQQSIFALRLRIKKENQIADGEALFFLISEVGPHAPDGQYARIKMDLSLPFNLGKDTPILIKPSSKSDTLVLEWSRQDERTIVGRIKSPEDVELHLIHYFPWNFNGKYQFLPDGHIAGESLTSKKYHYLLWTGRKGNMISSWPI